MRRYTLLWLFLQKTGMKERSFSNNSSLPIVRGIRGTINADDWYGRIGAGASTVADVAVVGLVTYGVVQSYRANPRRIFYVDPEGITIASRFGVLPKVAFDTIPKIFGSPHLAKAFTGTWGRWRWVWHLPKRKTKIDFLMEEKSFFQIKLVRGIRPHSPKPGILVLQGQRPGKIWVTFKSAFLEEKGGLPYPHMHYKIPSGSGGKVRGHIIFIQKKWNPGDPWTKELIDAFIEDYPYAISPKGEGIRTRYLFFKK